MDLEKYTEKYAFDMIKRVVELIEYQNNAKIKYKVKKCTENGTIQQ